MYSFFHVRLLQALTMGLIRPHGGWLVGTPEHECAVRTGDCPINMSHSPSAPYHVMLACFDMVVFQIYTFGLFLESIYDRFNS